MGFKDDLVYSSALVALVLAYACSTGNALHLGYWYLIALPVVMLIPGLVLRVQAMYLTGTTAAVVSTLVVYMAFVSSAGREGGLIGLGHLFSVPGMFVGASASAWLLRFRVNASLPWVVAGVSFLSVGFGFLIAQTIVCNTVMYCGALSFEIWL